MSNQSLNDSAYNAALEAVYQYRSNTSVDKYTLKDEYAVFLATYKQADINVGQVSQPADGDASIRKDEGYIGETELATPANVFSTSPLPCPFCGSPAKLLAKGNLPKGYCHFVCARGCEASVDCGHTSIESALIAWNTRHPKREYRDKCADGCVIQKAVKEFSSDFKPVIEGQS